MAAPNAKRKVMGRIDLSDASPARTLPRTTQPPPSTGSIKTPHVRSGTRAKVDMSMFVPPSPVPSATSVPTSSSPAAGAHLGTRSPNSAPQTPRQGQAAASPLVGGTSHLITARSSPIDSGTLPTSVSIRTKRSRDRNGSIDGHSAAHSTVSASPLSTVPALYRQPSFPGSSSGASSTRSPSPAPRSPGSPMFATVPVSSPPSGPSSAVSHASAHLLSPPKFAGNPADASSQRPRSAAHTTGTLGGAGFSQVNSLANPTPQGHARSKSVSTSALQSATGPAPAQQPAANVRFSVLGIESNGSQAQSQSQSQSLGLAGLPSPTSPSQQGPSVPVAANGHRRGSGSVVSASGPEEEEAAEAKWTRKILDLEISNKSLLAINATLEATKLKQANEIRELRRRIRDGRGLSLAPVEAGAAATSFGGGVESEVEEDEWTSPDEGDELEEKFVRMRALIEGMIARGKDALEFKYDDAVGGAKVLSAIEVEDYSTRRAEERQKARERRRAEEHEGTVTGIEEGAAGKENSSPSREGTPLAVARPASR